MLRENRSGTYHPKRRIIREILILKGCLMGLELPFLTMGRIIKGNFRMDRLWMTRPWSYSPTVLFTKVRSRIRPWTGKGFLRIKMSTRSKVCGKKDFLKAMVYKDAIRKVPVTLEPFRQAWSKAPALILGITEGANIKESSLKDWCMISMVGLRQKVVLSTVGSLSWEKDKARGKYKLWMEFWKEISRMTKSMGLVNLCGKMEKSMKDSLESRCLMVKEKLYIRMEKSRKANGKKTTTSLFQVLECDGFFYTI